MPTQRIVWTALPNGPAKDQAGTLALAVYLAPQLTDAATLEAFPDLLDWPATLKTLKFLVTITGAAPITVVPKLVADSALWKAFFPSKLTIQSFAPPTKVPTLNIQSYSVLGVSAHLKDLHQSLLVAKPNAAGFYDLPSTEMLAKKLFELAPPLDSTKLPAKFTPLNGPQTQRRMTDMRAVRRFQQRGTGAKNPKSLPTTAFDKPLEFHDIAAMLGEYPALLSLLGLTIELAVPFSGTTAANATVSVAPIWPDKKELRKDVSPRTALTTGAFYARSQDGSVERGFLKVGDASLFGTTPLDTDAGAAQVHAASDQLIYFMPMTLLPAVVFTGLKSQKEPLPKLELDDKPQVGLPVLRTVGVTLARNGRGAALQTALTRSLQHSKDIADNKPPVLFAEDITRGWRVDVRQVTGSSPGPWFSLCRREGKYTVRGLGAPLSKSDEGFVRSVTIEQDDKEGVHAHEALFRWHGWSLCVPRPGSPMPDGESQKSAFNVTWPLTDTAFTVPSKSLLPLRFGQTYQLRVRVADMAGQGPAPESTESATVTPAETFLRYDPIAPPVLLLYDDPTPGESAERLVIRSVDEKSKAEKPCTRHLAPPRTTVELAERHGMLDRASPTETYKWLTDYQGEFKEKAVDNPMKPGDKLYFLIEPTDSPIKTPYLADPLAQAAVVDNTIVSFGDPKNWPQTQSVRLRLEEGAAGITQKNGVVTVTLPKAETTTLTLSSVPTDGKRLDELGHWVTLKNNAQGQNFNVLYGTAMHGGNWQLTPWRELTLVHAVQKPLLAPDFKTCDGGRRALGATATGLGRFRLTCHAKSTEQIELVASWEEITDTGVVVGSGGRPTPPGKASTSGRLSTLMTMPGNLFSLRFKNGKIPEKNQGWAPLRDPDGYQRTQFDPNAQELLRGSRTPGDGITEQDPQLVFPDTKYRRVTLTPIATTRFREYFPPKLTENPKNITRTGAPAVIDVLSSARPDTPGVLSVVPVFKWERGKDKSVRQAGLRVYLQRGWFSSGDGEQLALVLASESSFTLSEDYTAYTTQWGSDPIWADEAQLDKLVRLRDLKQSRLRAPSVRRLDPTIPGQRLEEAAFKKTGLSLAESGILVDILAFDVAFDAEKNAWFADLPLTSSAYTPFIRLALARYQPRSMDNAHLSRVVLADFAQILPERTVSLTRGGPRIGITVSGPAPLESPLTKTQMTVQLQRKTGESDLDWQSLDTPISLNLTRGVWSGFLPAVPAQRVLIQELEQIGDNSRVVFAETLPL
ncbi:MAG: hypothetical protein NTX57_05890 [Armatimonadetes bacterium]|nr:hypothetical protein [Armatimonadota bacterium]